MSETFETVASAGIELENWEGVPDEPMELLEQWLVFDVLWGEPINTWDETNLVALSDRLKEYHGKSCAGLIHSDDGCAISLLLNPDCREAVREAEAALEVIKRGQHLDKAFYDEVVSERCQDIWETYETAERMDLTKLLDEPGQIVLAFDSKCPREVEPLLCERYQL